MSHPAFVCDAVLLDMDGTLVDSTLVVERQWRRWAARHELDPVPFLQVAHGRRTIDTLRELAPHLATDERAAAFDDEEAEDSQGVVPVPGAGELLAALPIDRWAVVTSATAALATVRLCAAGLPVPRVMVTADDVARGKPDSEGYVTAARLLCADPARCVVIEDTPAGLDAGRRAGMAVIAVTTTHAADALRASAVIPDLRRLRVEVRDGVIRLEAFGAHVPSAGS